MFRILIAVLFVFLQQALPAAGKEIASYPMPEGWKGTAYRDDDKASRFSHCVASASYQSGMLLMVSVTRDWAWNIAFINPKWTLQDGENVRLSYRFDSGPWLEETGTGIIEAGIMVAMPSEASLVTQFRKARVMEILVPEGRFGFELGGTSRMMAALGNCVKGYLDREGQTTASTRNNPKPTSEGEPKSSISSGTGILISQSGHVLTNYHVIDGCKSLKVTQTGDIARSAQVLRTDANNDLSVLKVAQIYNANDIAKFRMGRSVKAGETVAVYGYPLAGTLSVSGNIVSGNVTSLAGIADDVRFFQISAPVQPGNSGGPLLDASGLIIGVVNAQINEIAVAQVTGSIPQNVNFAIKGVTAMTFLEANSIAFETSSDTTTKPLTDIAEAAKRFGVLITCWSDSSENTQQPVASTQVVTSEPSTLDSGGSDQRLAAIILDAMRQKIEPCWTIPAGAREAERLLIKLEIKLNRDGTLAAYPILLNSSSHPAFGAAAHAAQAAVQACAPYDFLPADKYAMWQDMILNFDPTQQATAVSTAPPFTPADVVEAARKLKAKSQLPERLDEYTRLVDIRASGLQFIYQHELDTRLDVEDVAASFASEMRQVVTTKVCGQPDMVRDMQRGLIYVYRYRDFVGRDVAIVQVTAMDCVAKPGQASKAHKDELP